MSIKFTIPVKTVSPNRVRGNTRLAAIIHSARKKKERTAAKLTAMADLSGKMISLPAKVLLTRVSAGELDGDNLQASLKGCRDGVADFFGLDDASDFLKFEYAQRKCKRGQWSVEVEIA